MGTLKAPPKNTHLLVLQKLQKQIHRSLQKQTDHLLGSASPELQSYERAYRTERRAELASARRSSKDRLLAAILKNDVTFLGDFHTYPQSQRTALRLLRDLVATSGKKTIWKIGLEMIPTKYQSDLDDFQTGRIDVRRFHERIHYVEEWGFPWKNYAPIFEWAREKKIQLIALNRPRDLFTGSATLRRSGRKGELHDRDQWAAGVITDEFHAQFHAPFRGPSRTKRENRSLKILVLYGELHLARQHLPRQLETVSRAFLGKPLKSLCIYQNVDELYWQLAEARIEHLVPVLRLPSGDYTVISGTPWGKLQSLVSWIEGGASEGLAGPASEDDSSDPHLEFLSAMNRYGDLLCHFFGIENVSYGSLTVKKIDDADFVETLENASSASQRLYAKLIHSNQTVYLQESRTLFVPDLTENHAVEMAATHIFSEKVAKPSHQSQNRSHLRTQFDRWMLQSAFGFFGSLLINPKRKCDFKVDHLRRIRELRKFPKKRAYPEELLARELAVKYLRQGSAFLDRETKPVPSSSAVWIAARAVGQIFAKQLYHEFLHGTLTALQIRDVFLHSHQDQIRFKPELISLSKTDLL